MATTTVHDRTTTDLPPLDLPVLGASRLGSLALTGLRLAIGFQFLWAFLDKAFGLGYATPGERSWINGGSPTRGFLSGVSAGPLEGTFNAMAGNALYDWLFMAGLLGIGVALLLGVALRVAAASGGLLLTFMYLASWPLARIGNGEPTGSNNPVVDDHLVSVFALVVIAAFATRSAGYLGRRWADLPLVRSQPWLR